MPKPRSRWRRLLPRGVYLVKNPSARAVPFAVLQDRFGAMQFKDALEDFVANKPTADHRNVQDRLALTNAEINNLIIANEHSVSEMPCLIFRGLVDSLCTR